MQMADQVLILPPVGIGCSDHHIGFCGTLSLSHSTFIAFVKDIIQSVIQHGFNKIISLNSHGGNKGVIQVIVEQPGFANPDASMVGAM